MTQAHTPLFPILLVLVAALVATAAPARAQADETGRVRAVATNREAIAVVRSLVAQRRFAAARALIAGWQPDHPEHDRRVRYVEGMIASAEARYRDAAGIYREILADAPNLTSVRVELARVLFLARDDDAAAFHAERLVAAGVDDRLNGQMAGLIAAVKARRPLTARGYASLLPSTNLNGGTDRDTVQLGGNAFTIDREARRKSGIGVLLGGDVLYRQAFTPTAAFVASLAGTVRHYPELGRTLVTGEGSVGIEHEGRLGRFLTSVVAGGDMSDLREDLRHVGLRAEWSRRLAPQWRMTTSTTLRHEQDRNVAGNDGGWLGSTVTLDRSIGPSALLRAIGGASGARKAEDRFAYDEVLGGAGVYVELGWGITTYAQATVAARRYRDLYPGLTESREDLRTNAVLVLTKRDLSFGGLAPQLRYQFERNRSNAAFHDTTRHDLELRLTREF